MKKYIGNIVVRKSNFKADECFKKCLSMEEIDDTVPTLIIGLDNAREKIDDFNILVKRYNDNMLWWTFGKTERRVDYDKDMSDFHRFCIDRIITHDYQYHFVNLVNMTYSSAKKYIEFVRNCKEKRYFIDKDKFIFIYFKENGNNFRHICGFSLNTSSFLGINKEKIIKLVENNPFNRKILNFYSIPNQIRRMVNDDIPSEILLLDYFS